MMPLRDGFLCTMEIKLICLVFLGLFLGLCLASESNSDNPSTCRGYCEIFSDICKNGGTCVETSRCSNTGRCKCPPNYEGEHCQKLINPEEGKASQSTKKKPKRKHRNLLLLSLFKSLALPRSDSKYANNIGDSGPTKTHKDEVGTSNQRQDTNTVKKGTNTTPTTTTTTKRPTTSTLPSTTTIPTTSTSSTTREETTTETKTTTPTASESPVTSTENSDEVTTIAGESLTNSVESYTVNSQEPTTETKANEYQTTTELTLEQDDMQITTADGVNVDKAKINFPTPTAPVHSTTSVKTDQTNPSVLPSFGSSTESFPAKIKEKQNNFEEISSSKSGTLKLLDNSVKKIESHKTLGSLLIPKSVGLPPVKSVPVLKLPLIDNQEAIANSEKTGNSLAATKPSHSMQNEQIKNKDLLQSKVTKPFSTKESHVSTTASQLVSDIVHRQDSEKSSPLSETKNVDNEITFRELTGGKPEGEGSGGSQSSSTGVPETSNIPASTERSKSLINNVMKVVENALDKSEVTLINTQPSEKAESNSNSNSTTSPSEPPQSENKLYDKITTLTNRLTKEFASSLKKIIKSVFTEPDSSNTLTPDKDSNFDVIIPDNVNDLNQLDQHMHNIKPVNKKIDKELPTSSHVLHKFTDNPGVKPTVEGERLPDSQATASTADYTTTTSDV